MEQLRMRWEIESGLEKHEKVMSSLVRPEGFTYRTMNVCEEEIAQWLEIMKDGIYDADADASVFPRDMNAHEGYTPDGIFCAYLDGRMVGSVSAFCLSSGEGRIHMVGTLSECRGKGISTFLLAEAMERHIKENGCKVITLTTDDFRIPAIKSYVKEGFVGEEFNDEMAERWKAVYKLI